MLLVVTSLPGPGALAPAASGGLSAACATHHCACRAARRCDLRCCCKPTPLPRDLCAGGLDALADRPVGARVLPALPDRFTQLELDARRARRVQGLREAAPRPRAVLARAGCAAEPASVTPRQAPAQVLALAGVCPQLLAGPRPRFPALAEGAPGRPGEGPSKVPILRA